MSRNGSGVYTPPLNSWNPPVNGDQALPADWKAILDDVTNALTGSLAADGQTPITGILNFQNNRISNVGAPIGAGDALRFQQMQKGSNIASAATITIPIEGNLFEVTGTTGIATINDTFPGRTVYLYFQDACTLTHSANLLLPTGADATTVAGDILFAINTASGIWEIVWPRKCAPSTTDDDVVVQSQVFGVGDSFDVVSRTIGTTYTNTSGKWKFIAALVTSSATGGYIGILCNGTQADQATGLAAGASAGVSYMIPPGATYQYTGANIASAVMRETQ